MAEHRPYGTGKRKDATAKVWLEPGSGEILINDTPAGEYLKRARLLAIVRQPLVLTQTDEQYNVRSKVMGGGLSGQAGAVRHGIAKALVEADPDLRALLGPAGLLTRDPRVKERKHAGFRKARRGKQFSKR